MLIKYSTLLSDKSAAKVGFHVLFQHSTTLALGFIANTKMQGHVPFKMPPVNRLSIQYRNVEPSPN